MSDTNKEHDEINAPENAGDTENGSIAEEPATGATDAARAEESAGGEDIAAPEASDSGSAGDDAAVRAAGAAAEEPGEVRSPERAVTSATASTGPDDANPGRFPVGGEKTPFAGKMRAAGYVAGRRYDAVKNAIMSYRRQDGARIRSKISASGESFSIGRKTLAMLGLSGTTLRLFLALDPSEYPESKYHHKDMSGTKKYARCPLSLKLSSDRQVKYAVSLIDELMTANGLEEDPDYVERDMATVFGKAKRAPRRVVYVRVPAEDGAPELPHGGAEDTAASVTEVAPDDEAQAEDKPGEEHEGEERADDDISAVVPPEDANAKMPGRASVYDGSGEKIGKVRRGVWYDGEGGRKGEFRKSDAGVLFYDEDTAKGYLDGHDNVLTMSGSYVATLRKAKPFPLVLIIILLVALTVVSVLFATCSLADTGTPYAPVIFIADEEGTSWDETEDLAVFDNDVFDDDKIAPGLTGTYAFIFENRNEHTVTYSLTFSEINEYGISMGYTLKRDGAYLSGGENDYLGVSELGVTDLTIQSGSSARFELSWIWNDGNDEADTEAGENGASYTLEISLTAEVVM